ncbi:MAG: efflux transporter outer membrane subunit [Phycisphaeraceae bacterium]
MGFRCLFFAGVWCLSGCFAPPPRVETPFQSPPPFASAPGIEPAERWWIAFDDAPLDFRIEHALSSNFDLVLAWERLNAARALSRRTGAERAVDLDATAGAGRSESLTSGDDATAIGLGLAASYEVDLWGRIESRAEAESLRADASEADYRAAAISLSSAVALTWYRLKETGAQLALIASQLETNQTFEDLIRERFNVGLVRRADLVRQQQLVEATREQAIVLRAQREILANQLAVLEGRPAQLKIDPPATPLPELGPAPGAGLSSSLLRRRPDVQAALLRLEAADRDLAAAVTERYPRLNLTASLETVSERPGDLFQDWLASIAGQAIAPLLDGGERRAEVDRNAAIVGQRAALYGQTVLRAFAEVEDALAREAREAERLASLNEQLRLADAAVAQLQDQFLSGVADYLGVLTAIQDKQRLERDVIAARLDRVASRIALYRSLAGRFETPFERDDDSSVGEQEDRDE